ncbi:MAG: KEOPS complex subunit Cgi121, partial [Methanoregula sp.]
MTRNNGTAGSRENNEHKNQKAGEPFACNGSTYEICAAIATVIDRAAFLQAIRTIADAHNTHIICFNADMLAGTRHAHTALCHAVRSFTEGTMISNTLEMEALLFAAGSRQCSLAAPFGIHEGENHLYICCYPKCDTVWDALAPVIHVVEDAWSGIDSQKQAYLMDLFTITREELATTNGDRL